MNKPHPMAQIYGYIVCLVAVITFLICIANLITAVIDHGDPLHAGYDNDKKSSLASFEIYKMELLKSSAKDGEGKAAYLPDDQTLHSMYESAKAEKISDALHDSNRSIIVCSIVLFISIAIFITHWTWMRKLSKFQV
jgi:hypothetical protein